MAKEVYVPLETGSPKKPSFRQFTLVSKILSIGAAVIMFCLAFAMFWYILGLISCNDKLQLDLQKHVSENKTNPDNFHAAVVVNTLTIKVQSTNNETDHPTLLQKLLSSAVSSAKQKKNESKSTDQSSSSIPQLQLQTAKELDYVSSEEDLVTTPKIKEFRDEFTVLSQKDTTTASPFPNIPKETGLKNLVADDLDDEDIVNIRKKTKLKNNKQQEKDWDEEHIRKAVASVDNPKKTEVQLTKNEMNYNSYYRETNVHADNIIHNEYHYNYSAPSVWDTIQDIPVVGPVVKWVYHAAKTTVDYVKSWF